MKPWIWGVAWAFACGAMAAPLPLVTGNGYPPFTDERLPGGGLATRLVTAAFQRMGSEVTVDWLPWKRGYVQTLAGQYVATFPYLDTDERRRAYFYSEPLFQGDVYLYALPNNPESLTAAGLRNRVLCHPYGWALAADDALKEDVKRGKISLIQPPDLITCLEMVRRGRVDAALAVGVIADYLLASQPGPPLIHSPEPLATTNLYLIVPRSLAGGEGLVARFNAALAAMMADGSYQGVLTLDGG